jgi:hypothetical protein
MLYHSRESNVLIKNIKLSTRWILIKIQKKLFFVFYNNIYKMH